MKTSIWAMAGSGPRALSAALVGACLAGCVTDTGNRNVVATPEPATVARPSWWIPFFAARHTRQTFELTVQDVLSTAKCTWTESERTVFDVTVVPDDADGCIVCLSPPKQVESERDPSLAFAWLTMWSEQNPDGLRVTPTALAVQDADVLRGPWHVGDRFSLFGFALVFWVQAVGFVHFEVADLAPTACTLRFEMWFGATGPAVRGAGSIRFENDALGVTCITAHWTRSDDELTHDVVLEVHRTAVAPL